MNCMAMKLPIPVDTVGGRLVLTKFDNPGKLAQVGENMLVETLGSGKKVTGEAGTAGLGEIRSKSLSANE